MLLILGDSFDIGDTSVYIVRVHSVRLFVAHQHQVDMKDILARAINGDKSAESRLFELLIVRFELLAKRRIENEEDARDVTQEACVTVQQKYRTVDFEAGFFEWAFGVLRMKIGNYYQARRARKQTMVIDTDVTGDCPPNQGCVDLKLRLLACLRKVLAKRPEYARALNLIHQGYKAAEICDRLRVEPDHFYVILFRSRSLMRLCLEKGEV